MNSGRITPRQISAAIADLRNAVDSLRYAGIETPETVAMSAFCNRLTDKYFPLAKSSGPEGGTG